MIFVSHIRFSPPILELWSSHQSLKPIFISVLYACKAPLLLDEYLECTMYLCVDFDRWNISQQLVILPEYHSPTSVNSSQLLICFESTHAMFKACSLLFTTSVPVSYYSEQATCWCPTACLPHYFIIPQITLFKERYTMIIFTVTQYDPLFCIVRHQFFLTREGVV